MKFIIFILCVVYGLNPGKIPKKYISREDRLDDLKIIDMSQTTIITKNWKQQILFNNQELNDLHILLKINELETYIQKRNIIYYAWTPKCLYNSKNILFIITVENNIIRQILQSPYWNPEQIKSIELKKTLDKLKNIDYSYLYKKDVRYKLSWFNWYL